MRPTISRISRSLRFLLPAFLSLVILSGCGSDSKPDAAANRTITLAHFWSEPTQKKALEEQIAAFEKAHPGVKVELTELSWNDGKTKLLAAFNSNTAPDVIELGSDWVAQFSAAGVLADQDAIGRPSTLKVSETLRAPGLWGGKVYARPWVVDTRVLFINTGLLASAGVDTTVMPATWQDVLVGAEKVRRKGTEFYGFGANGPDPHRLYKKILPFFWSNGGDVIDASGKVVINSPENLQALETYLELARTGLTETQKALDQEFIKGNVGYWYSGSWLVDKIRKENPTLHYRVVPLPGFAGKPAMSFAGGEYLAISDGSEQKELARELVDFLVAGPQALAFCRALPGLFAPADAAVAGDPFLSSPERKVFAAQLASAKMTPVHPKWLDVEAVIEEEVSQALLGKKEPAQALVDAEHKLTALTGGAAAETGE
jgi:ABC-type glycerol-3-phosphate transport system substrate-binding protein